MKHLKLTLLAVMLVSLITGITLAQPPTTAKTFRMYNDATHSVSITSGSALGTGTFTWPQPALGIFKSDGTGLMSLGAVNLSSSDVTNILGPGNGGTGTNSFGAAGTIAYSTGIAGPLGFTAVGSVGQVLVSAGSGTPTWSNTLPSGTGVPFNLITSGINNSGQSMTVGSTSSLAPNGSGTITANQFIGSGSLTNAVDLNTGEVSGTLSVANGGTGGSTVGGAGSVAYSNGSTLAFTTPVGVSGQVLTSNGSGAPTWTSFGSQLIAKGRVPGDGTNFQYVITPGVGYTATSIINLSLESAVNQSLTVVARTATTFTVQVANVLSASEFIDYLVF